MGRFTQTNPTTRTNLNTRNHTTGSHAPQKTIRRPYRNQPKLTWKTNSKAYKKKRHKKKTGPRHECSIRGDAKKNKSNSEEDKIEPNNAKGSTIGSSQQPERSTKTTNTHHTTCCATGLSSTVRWSTLSSKPATETISTDTSTGRKTREEDDQLHGIQQTRMERLKRDEEGGHARYSHAGVVTPTRCTLFVICFRL